MSDLYGLFDGIHVGGNFFIESLQFLELVWLLHRSLAHRGDWLSDLERGFLWSLVLNSWDR